MERKERSKYFTISKYHDGISIVKGNYFYTEWINEEGIDYNRMLFDHSQDPLELDNLANRLSGKRLMN